MLQAGTILTKLKVDSGNSKEAIKNYDQSLRRLGKTSDTTTLSIKKLAGAAGIGLLAKGLFDFAKGSVNAARKLQVFNVQLSTMLKSRAQGAQMIKMLKDMANQTPFTSEQLINATKSLLAFGFAANEITPTLKILGDVSAGTGKDLSQLSIIFGKIKSTGYLMGQELNQLIDAGFNPLQVISEKTGRSMRDLKKDVSDGSISFDMVRDAFVTATSKGGKFNDSMKKISKTLSGLISTFEDSWQNFKEISGEVLLKPLTSAVEALTDMVKKANDFVKVFKENPLQALMGTGFGQSLLVGGSVVGTGAVLGAGSWIKGYGETIKKQISKERRKFGKKIRKEYGIDSKMELMELKRNFPSFGIPDRNKVLKDKGFTTVTGESTMVGLRQIIENIKNALSKFKAALIPVLPHLAALGAVLALTTLLTREKGQSFTDALGETLKNTGEVLSNSMKFVGEQLDLLGWGLKRFAKNVLDIDIPAGEGIVGGFADSIANRKTLADQITGGRVTKYGNALFDVITGGQLSELQEMERNGYRSGGVNMKRMVKTRENRLDKKTGYYERNALEYMKRRDREVEAERRRARHEAGEKLFKSKLEELSRKARHEEGELKYRRFIMMNQFQSEEENKSKLTGLMDEYNSMLKETENRTLSPAIMKGSQDANRSINQIPQANERMIKIQGQIQKLVETLVEDGVDLKDVGLAR